MLIIKNLKVSINDKQIIKGINLTINKGETHAIMGPNGTGKSTLAYVLGGKENYKIDEGTIIFKGKNLFEMSVEDRAREGLFIGFQYPVEIPGVSIINFLRTALNEIRKYRNQNEITSSDFLKLFREKQELLGLSTSLTSRAVNEGFSGGEKKRNEIFQMAILEPDLAILDETDSGLDIDALKIVANGVNKLKSPNRATIIITHYQRLLEYVVPDFVHIMYDGKIILSGNKDLALELEKKGYEWIKSLN